MRRSVHGWLLATAATVLAACGARTALDEPPPCVVDADCPPFADYCGNVSVCTMGRCAAGDVRDCSDTTICTVDACDPVARACTHTIRDRDGDGFPDGSCGGTDCDDHDPSVHPGAREICNDGLDNDCNGHIDCSDAACAADPHCAMCTPEICDDHRDNDCDMLIDCADPDCVRFPACCARTETLCDDGLDNDCDGLIDCLDPDCAHAPTCCMPHPEVCNGLDDDCDGVADDGVTCYFLDDSPIDAVSSRFCGAAWYSYGSPATSSANPDPDIRARAAVAVAIIAGPPSCGGVDVAVIADVVGNGVGGGLDGIVQMSPAPVPGVVVSDDPGECTYTAATGTANCRWTWQPCCTDGGLFGTFTGDFCVTLTLTARSRVTQILVSNGTSSPVPRAFGIAFQICGRTVPAVP